MLCLRLFKTQYDNIYPLNGKLLVAGGPVLMLCVVSTTAKAETTGGAAASSQTPMAQYHTLVSTADSKPTTHQVVT